MRVKILKYEEELNDSNLNTEKKLKDLRKERDELMELSIQRGKLIQVKNFLPANKMTIRNLLIESVSLKRLL